MLNLCYVFTLLAYNSLFVADCLGRRFGPSFLVRSDDQSRVINYLLK